jgi:predicted PurR-regulated permease PerM
VDNLRRFADSLIQPLQSVAVASIGVFGNILILVILSIYIALDRNEITAFLYRLVPPAYVPQVRILQASVSRSFGGFLRGQVLMGLLFALFTGAVNIVFGLPYAAVTTVAAGLLQMIPFFGPFISWAPPVLVALLLPNGPVLPVLILMAIAWFVTMNVVQPRLMADSVGIHPIVVLGSVVIGLRIAGIAGAIFGIPIAAVISALFFHWVARSREHGTVADRATRRLARREGRAVRRPREPVPGVDEDVDEVAVGTSEGQSASGFPAAAAQPPAGPAPPARPAGDPVSET